MWAFFLLAVVTTYLVRDHVFFWDTVQLGAKHATWYYDQQFGTFFLPTEIDSGHPPYFGMYLATWWLLFGKNLMVSHFAMLPFLLLTIYFFFRIGEYLAPQRGGLLVLLLYSDPVLAAQSTLVSPDVALVCFFSMAIFAVFHHRSLLLMSAIIGLGMVSLRGMMVGLALFFFEIIHRRAYGLRAGSRALLPYLPGGLAALFFLYFHFHYLGWIGYHADSPWAPSFAKVGPTGAIRNLAIVGWRLLDYGRVAIFLLLVLLFLKKPRFTGPYTRSIVALVVVLGLLTLPSMLLHRHLSAHRYLLPLSISLELLVFYQLFRNKDILINGMKPSLVYSLTVGLLITGNLWIYPPQIAQGWDATLAHLPYYELREKMWSYIHKNEIPPDQIGTSFPEIGPLQFRDPAKDGPGFAAKNLQQQEYIFYCNVMNDFSDEELSELNHSWEVVQSYRKSGIIVLLYRKK